MARDGINIRVKADLETNAELQKWARDEGRSKRLHAAVMLRRLTRVRRENPGVLKEAGLDR
jgi:hypothetical protein